MKEASGELSMTAITVVAIAAIAVVFTTLVWPGIRNTIRNRTNCAQAHNFTNCNGGMCDACYFEVDRDGNEREVCTLRCPDAENTGTNQ